MGSVRLLLLELSLCSARMHHTDAQPALEDKKETESGPVGALSRGRTHPGI